MVGGSLKDVLLCLHPVYILIICNEFLLDHFHGINSLRLFQFYQEDLSIAASPDDPDHLKVIQTDRESVWRSTKWLAKQDRERMLLTKVEWQEKYHWYEQNYSYTQPNPQKFYLRCYRFIYNHPYLLIIQLASHTISVSSLGSRASATTCKLKEYQNRTFSFSEIFRKDAMKPNLLS